LGAVVQVAAEPAALLVAGLDDPGPRGRQLVARIHIRQRGGDQLGELGEPMFGGFGESVGASTRCERCRPMSSRRQ
jgi:hypothetical protein